MQQNRYYPEKNWEYITSPEKVGWSARQLYVAQVCAEVLGAAAVMVVTGGKVLVEWGDATRRLPCHSMRKSLLSSLFGRAVQEGKMQMTQTLEELGIDDNEPGLTEQEKQATIADLLMARSGVYHPSVAQSNSRLPARGSHAPGTFWHYNNWDFNVLGTIYEQCTHRSLYAAFRQQVAAPLQMEDFLIDELVYKGGGPDSLHPAYWFHMPFAELEQRGPEFLRRPTFQPTDGVELQSMETFPEDLSAFYVGSAESVHPCYWFRMSARDLARFGWLFLCEGQWQGKTIIPQQWVKESTTAYSPAWSGSGYGYMWWVAVDGNLFPGVSLPEGTFAALGMGGHNLLVIPEYDTVIVYRMDSETNRQVWSFSRDVFGRFLKVLLAAREG
jgi:CubicO group peptidase (beta-lactamase class C family)